MWKDCYITLGSSADDSASESGDDEPSPAKPAAAKGGKKAAAASTKSGKSNAQAAEEGDWIGEWMVSGCCCSQELLLLNLEPLQLLPSVPAFRWARRPIWCQ